MPYVTPELKPVQTANVFQVLEIDILNNTPPQIRIYWRYGTKVTAAVHKTPAADASGSEPFEVTWTGNLNKVYDATALGTLRPDGTKTWYENVKTLAYTMLVDGGDIPAVGAVS